MAIRTRAIQLSVVTVCLVLLSAAPSWAQEKNTGLKFTPQAQLLGIPLASSPYAGTELPPSVDLSDRLPLPGDQAQQNSCVAWTVAYALKSYQEETELHWGDKTDLAHIFSPAFVYNQINNGVDGGAQFTDALNLLSSQGAAPLTAMPYDANDFRRQPDTSARNIARLYRIDTWRQVNVSDTREIKAQINAGYPVMIGAMVDDGFMHLPQGHIWRQVVGQQRGGHAMLVVGYDDSRNAFKLINSWGTSWGDHGYGWIDYGFFSAVVREGFVAKDAQDGPAPGPASVPPGPQPPAPVSANVSFAVTAVQHNVPSQLGIGMLFTGTFDVPSNVHGRLQIVVSITRQNGATIVPLPSTTPTFSTVQGQAATGTPPLMLNGTALHTTWYAFLPYSTLNIPHGINFTPSGPQGFPIQTNLIATPSLFLDNFGIKSSTPIPFFVRL